MFADARLEVIGPELFEHYLDLQRRIESNDPSWTRTLDGLVGPLLTDHVNSSAVGRMVLGSPRWRCVWFDPIAMLFVHDSYAGISGTMESISGAGTSGPSRETIRKGAALLASAKARGCMRIRCRRGASRSGAAAGVAGGRSPAAGPPGRPAAAMAGR